MSYLDLIDQNAGSHHSESPLVSQRQFCLSQAVAATRATLLLAMAIRIEDAAIGISSFSIHSTYQYMRSGRPLEPPVVAKSMMTILPCACQH